MPDVAPGHVAFETNHGCPLCPLVPPRPLYRILAGGREALFCTQCLVTFDDSAED